MSEVPGATLVLFFTYMFLTFFVSDRCLCYFCLRVRGRVLVCSTKLTVAGRLGMLRGTASKLSLVLGCSWRAVFAFALHVWLGSRWAVLFLSVGLGELRLPWDIWSAPSKRNRPATETSEPCHKQKETDYSQTWLRFHYLRDPNNGHQYDLNQPTNKIPK